MLLRERLYNYATSAIGDASPLFATVAPYLEFDVQTNRVVFHAEQLFNYEVYTSLSVMGRVNVYLNTRLYDLSVRLPYNLVSTTGELHYRINVLYNNSNSVFTTVLVFSVPTATTQNR